MNRARSAWTVSVRNILRTARNIAFSDGCHDAQPWLALGITLGRAPDPLHPEEHDMNRFRLPADTARCPARRGGFGDRDPPQHPGSTDASTARRHRCDPRCGEFRRIRSQHPAVASACGHGRIEQRLSAAIPRGLDTCPQVAFTKFHRVIAAQLGIPDRELLVCGMSLGYADPNRVENSLVTEREPVDRFTTYHDDKTETSRYRLHRLMSEDSIEPRQSRSPQPAAFPGPKRGRVSPSRCSDPRWAAPDMGADAERCYGWPRLSSRRGIRRGDTVSIIAPNTPAMLEALSAYRWPAPCSMPSIGAWTRTASPSS